VTKGVLYSGRLVQSLEKSLRSAFNQPFLRLTRQSQKLGDFYVQMDDGTRTAQMDDSPNQMLVDIRTTDRKLSTFYVGFVALFVFAPTRKYSLQHASLSVFHDIVGELMPLFRADWDQLAALSENSTHAQPHWHFVQRPERIEGIVRTLMRSPSDTAEFAPEHKSGLFSGLVDCGKFHFAMTSLWEKDSVPPPKRLFDSDDFPGWFSGLTSYIADQIAYLVSIVPPTATTVARAFNPNESATDGG